MLKDSRKSQPNQQFYLKKLHTETFSSPSMKDQFLKLGDKMQLEIQMVKRRLRVKNLKMFKAQQKLKTMEKQQNDMREALRNNIENKLKQSESKLESMMVTKNSHSNSKEKLRQTTLSRIKSMEKTFVEQSFRKSQSLSKESETFFLRKDQEKYSRTSSFVHTQSKTRYIQNQEKMNESMASTSSRKKILPRVLKVTQKDIKERQFRKTKLEESKDTKNLYEYIQKLNDIDAKRQNRSFRLTQTVKLIQKQRKKEQERYESKKKAQSLGQKDKVPGKSYASATRDAIKNKYSFSELYAKKLQEKLQKKSYFQQLSIQSGNVVMKKQGEIRQKKRQNRLVNQAVRQVQRKVNFKYMQRFKK